MRFKNTRHITFILAFLLIGTLNLLAQTGSRYVRWLSQDPIQVFGELGRDPLPVIGVSTVSFLAISPMDERNSIQFQKRFTNSRYLNIANDVGDIRVAGAASAAVFGLTLFSRDQRLQDAAFTSFQAVLNTAITVNLSKFIFARSRPFENDGAYDFDFFQRNATSFPSGHTSTAFALITPWVVYYPNLLSYFALAIPVSTAIARIAKGKHWLSDVSAGAFIGAYWGYSLAKSHLSIQHTKVQINPVPLGQGAGISLNIKL